MIGSEPGGAATGLAEVPARLVAAQLPWAAAWERVSAKAGMPGVDGMSVGQFRRTVPSSIRLLEQRLAAGEYRPLPLRMAELEKKRSGRRLLLVPAVRDRIAQTAVAAWLGARWDAQFDRASFAYRPGRGVHAALRYLRQLHQSGFRWVFDADIRSCFDSIEHGRLFERLGAWLGTSSAVLGWVRQWTAAAVWDGADVTRLGCGIPQGSPLSPLLANFFLDGFDRRLRAADVKFIRYADDFLVLTRTPFDLGPARAVVAHALAELGLELNLEKTRSTTFERRFRFLGAEIEGDAILLPFDKQKTMLRPIFVAPVMPAALLKAWRLGHVTDQRPFERRSPPETVATPAGSRARASRLLTTLAGRPTHMLKGSRS